MPGTPAAPEASAAPFSASAAPPPEPDGSQPLSASAGAADGGTKGVPDSASGADAKAGQRFLALPAPRAERDGGGSPEPATASGAVSQAAPAGVDSRAAKQGGPSNTRVRLAESRVALGASEFVQAAPRSAAPAGAEEAEPAIAAAATPQTGRGVELRAASQDRPSVPSVLPAERHDAPPVTASAPETHWAGAESAEPATASGTASKTAPRTDWGAADQTPPSVPSGQDQPSLATRFTAALAMPAAEERTAVGGRRPAAGSERKEVGGPRPARPFATAPVVPTGETAARTPARAAVSSQGDDASGDREALSVEAASVPETLGRTAGLPAAVASVGGSRAAAAGGELAFAARLVAAAPDAPAAVPAAALASPRGTGESSQRAERSLPNGQPDAEPRAAMAAAGPEPAAGELAGSPDEASHATGAPAAVANGKALKNAPAEPELPVPLDSGDALGRAGSLLIVPGPGPEPRRAAVAGGALSGRASEPAATPVERGPEPAATREPARTITLEVNQGQQRVAVRVLDRGGEIHLDVRTPDAGLAGALRRDLPSLAARLEQTGLRAESWRTEGTGRHSTDAGGNGAAPERNGQGRPDAGERRERQPQPEQTEPTPHPKKEERKEFAWFLSSLG